MNRIGDPRYEQLPADMTDAELNAAVASEVMGWTWEQQMSRSDWTSYLANYGVTQFKRRRRKSVQHESHEMERLADMVWQAWWAPGWWRWEHATMHRQEAWRNAREGVRPGWPDCGLFVPGCWDDPVSGFDSQFRRADPDGWRVPVLAVLELKATDRKPKRGGKGGVTDAQLACLQDLERCGFRVTVAYGADEAFDWLNTQAGPRPRVLPWRDRNEGEQR